MRRSLKAVFAGRILLPVALLIGCAIRINLVSLSYLIFLMAMPFIPPPTIDKVSWLTMKYTLFIMGISLMALVVPVIFHICLFITQPYGRDFINCELYETISRQIGLQKLDKASSDQIIRLIAPEVIVACASIFAYRVYQSQWLQYKFTTSTNHMIHSVYHDYIGTTSIQQPTDEMPRAPTNSLIDHVLLAWSQFRKSDIWAFLKKISLAIFVCGAGISHSNLLSFIYFFLFLILANLWILNISLTPLYRIRLVKMLVIISGIHILIIYLYQFELFQEFINRHSISARLLGLTAIYVVNCEDVTSFNLNPNYQSSYALHFIMLGVLYRICVEEAYVNRFSFETTTNDDVQKGTVIEAEVRPSSFIRRLVNPRKTRNWMTKFMKSRSLVRSNAVRKVDYELSRHGRSEQRPIASVSDKSVITYGIDQGSEKKHVDIPVHSFKRVFNMDTISRVKDLIERYSYVGCLLAMMTWSVTYHSWMTFVLLLLSCVIWMVPNPRRFCLRITPYLVCYAEVLLIFQYIYGLDLSESELPSETIPALHQIGFVKPNTRPAYFHLFIKLCYTLAFWITFKVYLRERREGVVDLESGNAFHTNESNCNNRCPPAPKAETEDFVEETIDKDTSILETDLDAACKDDVEKSPGSISKTRRARYLSNVKQLARQKNLIPKLAAWVHRTVAHIWIGVCCAVLLFISLRQRVVGYTIVYMGFLLTFINFFLISFRLWRKFLHYFWTFMIFYCMFVLSLIYTYQFRKFPEMWHYGTGWSYDVLESMGLEQYNEGELLLKLLTPISFLICAIIQLKFFNKRLLDRTANLEKALSETISAKLSTCSRNSDYGMLNKEGILRANNLSNVVDCLNVDKSVPCGHTTASDVSNFPPEQEAFMQHENEGQMVMSPTNSIVKTNPWMLNIAAVPIASISASISIRRKEQPNFLFTGYCSITLPEKEFWSVSSDGDTDKPMSMNTSNSISINDDDTGKSVEKLEVDVVRLVKTNLQKVLTFLTTNNGTIVELVWRILEMHLAKAIALQMMKISISEVSALHVPYPILVAIMLAVAERSRTICKLTVVWSSVIMFVKMVFQMKFVNPASAIVNCSSVPGVVDMVYSDPFPFLDNRTVDSIEWVGFYKSDNIANHLQPYLLLMGLLITYELVYMRQALRRAQGDILVPLRGVLFEDITRREADDGLLSCVMYFANYFFYKFGLEVCLVTMVATIGIRCDFISLLYAGWLVVFLNLRRRKIAQFWHVYVIFLAIAIPVQYLARLGMPPSVCSSYPWSFMNSNLLEWLYLPDFMVLPNAAKLEADFVQLLFASCQAYVFKLESGTEGFNYPGGDNSELVEPLRISVFKSGLKGALKASEDLDENDQGVKIATFDEPVADFISYPKSYLDLLKILVFEHLYWGTLIAVFIAGMSRVTLFTTGYIVAGFLFLWFGNELFLKPLRFGLRLWDMLILYNAVMIIMKVALQVIGCVFMDDLYKNYCWCLQLFGIACIQKRIDPTKVFEDHVLADCKMPTAEATIIFDGICFAFLLAQRRIIASRYFAHVVIEFGAQHVFANRGADLIKKIRIKEIKERHVREREIIVRIKQKMEKIKEAQAKAFGIVGEGSQREVTKQQEPQASRKSLIFQRLFGRGRKLSARDMSAFEMDDELNDAVYELDISEEKEVVPEKEEDRRKGLGPLQLLNIAFKKGDIKAAVEDAKEVEAQEAELEKKMTDSSGRPDKKAIRKALRKRATTRVLPDFDEDTFDAEDTSTDAMNEDSGQSFQRRSSEVSCDSYECQEVEDEFEAVTKGTPSNDSSPERNKKLGTIIAETFFVRHAVSAWSAVVEFVNNMMTFLKLFFNGVVESTIAWLLKISREYRYVTHVLRDEKNTFKAQNKLKLATFNRGPSLLSISHSRKLGGHRRGSGGPEKRRLNRGLSFYNRKLAEEEAKKFNTDRNVLVRLFTSTYYVFLSRSDLFCYLLMVLAHMASASLITMPLPIIAFVWGTLSVPQPTKRFWITVIYYTEMVIIIKYLFQFGFFPWNKGASPPSPFFPPRILGIEQGDGFATWDLALLIVLFFHRWNLKTLGLWKERQDEEGAIRKMSDHKHAQRRFSSRQTQKFEVPLTIPEDAILEKRLGVQTIDLEDSATAEDLDMKLFPNSRLARRIRRHYRSMKSRWKKVKIRKWIGDQSTKVYSFFETLINPKYRCAVDVYALMFLCDFICFAILIFGYWAFGTETSSGGIASYFEENKIPGPFVAMLVVQFILIIIDRALFLRKYLLGKVIYQIGLVLFIHVWIFFILPAVTERQFINNTPAKLWYFVKCIYFCLSAWQIRAGYPTRVLGNMLTKNYNIINMLLFKGFMTVPFLFELRALMDWIWTDTSMSLSDWLKLEDIYSNIYQIKCERQIEEDYPTPRAVKKRPLLKYGWGGFLLFLMILIIWFPLVLFSLANTVGLRSPPVNANVKLTLGTYPALFQAHASEQSMIPLTESEFASLRYQYRHSKLATAYMSDYAADDVIRLTFEGYSENVWAISPPSKSKLIDELNSTKSISMKFEWQFTRAPDGIGDSNVVSDHHEIQLAPGHDIREKLISMLIYEDEETSVLVPRLYPPYVNVPGKGKATPVQALLTDKTTKNYRNAFSNSTLRLLRTKHIEYWKLSTSASAMESDDFIHIVGFVDKVFPSTFNVIAGGGIIGLYVSLVLVAGNFIRGLVSGAMSKIMFEELPNADRILQLCLDIFLVREAGELALEEDLFAKLIFIYRSPATLIKWTKVKKT